AVALKQIHESPTNPRELDQAIPDYIEDIILRCLAKDPTKRFQSVDEIQSAMLEKSLPAEPIPPLVKARKYWAIGVTVLVAVFVVAVLLKLRTGSAPDIDRALRSATDAELAGFHMAESLNTVEAWNTFLKTNPAGELSAVANARIEKLTMVMGPILRSSD